MVRWMCGIKLSDRVSSSELRKRLGLLLLLLLRPFVRDYPGEPVPER